MGHRKRKDGGVRAEHLIWAVKVASRYVPGATCLTQALAAKLLLQRCGLDSTVRFGVAKPAAGKVEAHAWLESQGKIVLGDTDLGHYAELMPWRRQDV